MNIECRASSALLRTHLTGANKDYVISKIFSSILSQIPLLYVQLCFIAYTTLLLLARIILIFFFATHVSIICSDFHLPSSPLIVPLPPKSPPSLHGPKPPKGDFGYIFISCGRQGPGVGPLRYLTQTPYILYLFFNRPLSFYAFFLRWLPPSPLLGCILVLSISFTQSDFWDLISDLWAVTLSTMELIPHRLTPNLDGSLS